MAAAEPFGMHRPVGRVRRLGGALRRPGDLAVPRRRADRREVGHLAARRWRSSPSRATGARSQRIARAASTREIVPDGRRVTPTKGPRARHDPREDGARLQTLSDGGRITAAVASQISDGPRPPCWSPPSGAVREHGLTPRARIHHLSVARRRPGLHADRRRSRPPSTRSAERADDRRHRPRRDQRGLRPGRPGLAARDRSRPGEGQRQRRRHRARPPARRHRRAAHDDPAARARAHRRPLRPADHVRGRRQANATIIERV